MGDKGQRGQIGNKGIEGMYCIKLFLKLNAY